jgi:hypothetical protein
MAPHTAGGNLTRMPRQISYILFSGVEGVEGVGGSRFGFWKQNTTNHDEKYPLMPVLFESVDFM